MEQFNAWLKATGQRLAQVHPLAWVLFALGLFMAYAAPPIIARSHMGEDARALWGRRIRFAGALVIAAGVWVVVFF